MVDPKLIECDFDRDEIWTKNIRADEIQRGMSPCVLKIQSARLGSYVWDTVQRVSNAIDELEGKIIACINRNNLHIWDVSILKLYLKLKFRNQDEISILVEAEVIKENLEFTVSWPTWILKPWGLSWRLPISKVWSEHLNCDSSPIVSMVKKR